MAICPVCGKVNAVGARHCDLCGAPLLGADPAHNLAPQTNGSQAQGDPNSDWSGPICPVCRRTNRSNSVFCAFCGYRLKPDAQASEPQPPTYPPPVSAPASDGGASISRPRVAAPAPDPAQIAADESGNLPANLLLKRRYRILRKIAQGGMGAVYEAVDTHAPAGTRWAVKEMSPGALPSSERSQAITDFRREAQMLAALQHPNLPQVVETFEEMGKHFLVMEFVPGHTLQNVLDNTPGFVSEERVRVWARQLLDVINYLHSQNPPIIYRDIKPSNVMLVEGTERIKLIDFGIARFHKAGKARDTEAFGTAGYAPPEQYGKGQTDQRSDVYALGATLHYLLTHHDPGLNPFSWLPARQYNLAVSPQMESALQRALNLDPARRFQTVQDFAAAVGMPVGAPVSGPFAAPAPVLPAGQPQAPILTPVARPPDNRPPAQVGSQRSGKQRGGGQSKQRTQSGSRPRGNSAPVSPPVVAPLPAAASAASGAPVAAASAAPATAASQPAAPTRSGPAAWPHSGGPNGASRSPAPSHAEAAPDHGTTSTAGQPPAPLADSAVDGAREQSPALVVSDHVLDLGEATWNKPAMRRIDLVNVGGGEMKGTVISTQPWVALSVQSFRGNAQTVEVRVRPRQLPFGRVELHVPNLFAIIWARTKWALPFIGLWFWVVLLLASSVGKLLVTGLLGLIGLLVLAEVLIWLWAMHVRLLVPNEKLNSGRLLVKSSGGDQQIEVRVRARPSRFRKALGWVLAVVLFAAEIAAVAWIVLVLTNVIPVPGWLGI